MGTAVPVAEPHWSGAHVGLTLYLQRLLAPLGDRPLVVPADPRQPEALQLGALPVAALQARYVARSRRLFVERDRLQSHFSDCCHISDAAVIDVSYNNPVLTEQPDLGQTLKPCVGGGRGDFERRYCTNVSQLLVMSDFICVHWHETTIHYIVHHLLHPGCDSDWPSCDRVAGQHQVYIVPKV